MSRILAWRCDPSGPRIPNRLTRRALASRVASRSACFFNAPIRSTRPRRLVRRLDGFAIPMPSPAPWPSTPTAPAAPPMTLTSFCRAAVSINSSGKSLRSGTIPSRVSRRFVERQSGVKVDVLITGGRPGFGQPVPLSFPNPSRASETIERTRPFIALAELIQLKLCARPYYDFGDVAKLIKVHNLDESYLKKIHPFVHQDFIECLEEKRREEASQQHEQ